MRGREERKNLYICRKVWKHISPANYSTDNNRENEWSLWKRRFAFSDQRDLSTPTPVSGRADRSTASVDAKLEEKLCVMMCKIRVNKSRSKCQCRCIKCIISLLLHLFMFFIMWNRSILSVRQENAPMSKILQHYYLCRIAVSVRPLLFGCDCVRVIKEKRIPNWQ